MSMDCGVMSKRICAADKKRDLRRAQRSQRLAVERMGIRMERGSGELRSHSLLPLPPSTQLVASTRLKARLMPSVDEAVYFLQSSYSDKGRRRGMKLRVFAS